jgi:two-component system KDP operon response regulator KdpE
VNNKNITILVVEDDNQINRFLCYALEHEGYKYLTVGTAQGALGLLVTEHIDLVLLDLGLPDFDGLEVIKKVREWSEVPIIIISAREQDKEKAQALDLGADDFLSKPFSAIELMARIRVAVRHLYKNSATISSPVVTVKEVMINFDKRLVYLRGEEVHLTPMEYNLMALFLSNIGKILTTKTILHEIWGVSYGSDTQALRTLMAGLRRKIEENPGKPKYIVTEIGVGYRFKDE